MTHKAPSLFDWNIAGPAVGDAFKKLDPRLMIKNPVMFVTMVGAALTTVGIFTAPATDRSFIAQLAIWLWFTVLFANFAEAVAEGRGKAQATGVARHPREDRRPPPRQKRQVEEVSATDLRKGDVVVVHAGEIIPADGDVIEGAATVDESAITGESAPVIRESGGDRSAVTGGTRVLSDEIKIRISINPGEGFLDRMIALVEGATRQKTPNEIALTILLAALTLIFLLVCVTLKPFGIYSATVFSVPVLIALLVCLIPTTIGGLLSAIGIAGMDRLLQHNVLAMSGRAVEASGDVDVLLARQNRHHHARQPPGHGVPARAAGHRRTPGRRRATGVARRRNARRPQHRRAGQGKIQSARTRSRGRARAVRSVHRADAHERRGFSRRWTASPRGASAKARRRPCEFMSTAKAAIFPQIVSDTVDNVARSGGTPLVVADGREVLGVIHLKDIVKGGIKERFAQLRKMGIRTVMITGDNKLTAAAIAAEAGVDDFLAEAKPEDKLALHPQGTSGRSHGGHDRRRHQRRPGARAGRCRRGHEHRHAGRQGSRQHGGPRLESDEAHRDHRNRQTTAHHARLADHVQHRQRRGQIFRHHSRHVDGHVPGHRAAQRHAPAQPGQRHPERHHFQRARSSSR